LLVLELSPFSLQLFRSVIGHLLETISSLEYGWFSVWVLNSGLSIPILSFEQESFSLLRVCDLDSMCLPPPYRMFFDMDCDKELFIQYLRYLQTLEPLPIRCSVLPLVTELNRLYAPSQIPVVLLMCQLPSDDLTSVQAVASAQLFKRTAHVERVLLAVPTFSQDIRPLLELSIF
jgi:hypothetical protein